MNKKKQVFIRVRKVGPKRYLIEQRRKFLWLWQFFQKGCPTLGLKTLYINRKKLSDILQAAGKSL